MATPIGLDPVNYVSTVVGNYVLGAIYQDETTGALFRYLQNHATDGALVAGCSLVPTLVANNSSYYGYNIVTKSGGASQLSGVVGMAVRAVPVANYFFALVWGQYAFALNAANTVTSGTPVKVSATAGNWANVTAVTDIVSGWAEANASGGVFPMMIRCL